VEGAKWYILDAFGCALAGSHSRAAQIASAYVQELGGRPEATLIRAGVRVPAADAAFVNTLCGRADTFDDTHEAGIIHAGVALTMSGLAMAERGRRTGRDLITAMIAGAEVALRVALSVQPGHYQQGFHTTGTCTAFGTAVTAASLLGLDAAATQAALGLAGDQASSVRQYQLDGSIANSALHAAVAARAGIASALLAGKGFPAPLEILEGEHGFCRVFAPAYDAGILTGGLGAQWRVLETSIKPYPSCRYLHGAVDAVERLVRSHNLVPANVAEVTVDTFTMAVQECDRPLPTAVRDAQFSIQYNVARVLLDRAVRLEDFTPGRIAEENAIDLERRIQVNVDPDLDQLNKQHPERWPFRVCVRTVDGRKLIERVDYAPGSPGNPLAREQVLKKFRGLAETVLPPERASALEALVLHLDRCTEIDEVAALLHAAGRQEQIA